MKKPQHKHMPRTTTFPSNKKGYEFKVTLTTKVNLSECKKFFGYVPSSIYDLNYNNIHIVQRIEELRNGIVTITEATPEYPIFLLAHINEEMGDVDVPFIYQPYANGARLCSIGHMEYTDEPNTLYWCIE